MLGESDCGSGHAAPVDPVDCTTVRGPPRQGQTGPFRSAGVVRGVPLGAPSSGEVGMTVLPHSSLWMELTSLWRTCWRRSCGVVSVTPWTSITPWTSRGRRRPTAPSVRSLSCAGCRHTSGWVRNITDSPSRGPLSEHHWITQPVDKPVGTGPWTAAYDVVCTTTGTHLRSPAPRTPAPAQTQTQTPTDLHTPGTAR